LRNVFAQYSDRVRNEALAEVRIQPGASDDTGAERGARVVPLCRLGCGDVGVDLLGIDVPVLVETALECLGSLRRSVVRHGISKSLSGRSALTV
jgi:hypothetical protein